MPLDLSFIDAGPADIGAIRRQQDLAQYLAEREARVQLLAERVDHDLKRRGKSHRGARRQVVCLSDLDPSAGGHPIFRSASEAGASINRACDNVCQAIRRHGICGGKSWGYLDQLKGGHVVETAAGRFWRFDEMEPMAVAPRAVVRHNPAGPVAEASSKARPAALALARSA